MVDINERRLLQRTNLALYLDVYDADKKAVLGNIIDINIVGFLIMTKQTLAESTEYSIEIALPEHIGDVDFICCKAVIRRVVKSVNPSFDEAGFEIVDISPDNRELIEKLEHQLLLKFGQTSG